MKRNFFLLLLLLFCNTGNAEEESEFSEAMLPLEDLRVFAESFKRIRSSYVDDITDQDLLILAIKGMLAELDPHSAYLDKEAIKNFEESTSGNYGGLGLSLIHI